MEYFIENLIIKPWRTLIEKGVGVIPDYSLRCCWCVAGQNLKQRNTSSLRPTRSIMKLSASVFFLVVLLPGCQAPIVSTRNYAFNAAFIVNEMPYNLNVKYTCHFEDVGWISTRGPGWHIREGNNKVRIIGELNDGAQLEILPYITPDRSFDYSPNVFDPCSPQENEAVDIRLFIVVNDSKVESFDKARYASTARNVQLVDSNISVLGTGFDTFVKLEDRHGHIHTTKRYYSVWASTYENSTWKDKSVVTERIKNKKIIWLDRKKSYIYSGWSNEDAIFAIYDSDLDKMINTKENYTRRFSLVPSGDSWIAADADHDATQWLAEPVPSDNAEAREDVPSNKFKRWVEYQGAKIELPIRDNYSRLFYDPESDQLILFSTQHVDLW